MGDFNWMGDIAPIQHIYQDYLPGFRLLALDMGAQLNKEESRLARGWPSMSHFGESAQLLQHLHYSDLGSHKYNLVKAIADHVP